MRTFGPQQDHAHVFICGRAHPGVVEFFQELFVLGVALLRPVQRDDRHPIFDVVKDVFGHIVLPEA